MSYVDPFRGSVIYPALVAYRYLAFSASKQLYWPASAASSSQELVGRLMDLAPAAGSLALTMPDATQVGVGFDVFFNNIGAYDVTLKDSSGATIATISAGSTRYLYLTDNSTAAGTWRTFVLGAVTATTDAASLAGAGLEAEGSELQLAMTVRALSADYTIATSDRANVLTWTGGVGTFYLPTIATVAPDFVCSIRNAGTGALTLDGDGSETVDDAASLTLQPGESLMLHAGTPGWYTVGRGRNAQFNFSLLSKAIASGDYTLTPIEAGNVVHKYTGTLTNDVNIILPSAVQVYYVNILATGTSTVTFKTAGVGAEVDLASGATAVLVCDGLNVYNSATWLEAASSGYNPSGSYPVGTIGDWLQRVGAPCVYAEAYGTLDRTGSTSASSIIQDAVDNNPGATIVLPLGSLLVDTTITVSDNRTCIVGSGPGTIVINATTDDDAFLFEPTSTLKANYLTGCCIGRMTITRETHTATAGAGVRIKRTSGFRLRDVTIQDCPEGFQIHGGQLTSVRGLRLYGVSMQDISATDNTSLLGIHEGVCSDGYQIAYTHDIGDFVIGAGYKVQSAMLLASGDGTVLHNGYVNGGLRSLLRVTGERDGGYIAACAVNDVYMDCLSRTTGTTYGVEIVDDGYSSFAIYSLAISGAAGVIGNVADTAIYVRKPVYALTIGDGLLITNVQGWGFDYEGDNTIGNLSISGAVFQNLSVGGGATGTIRVKDALSLRVDGNSIAGDTGTAGTIVCNDPGAGTVGDLVVTDNLFRVTTAELVLNNFVLRKVWSGNTGTLASASDSARGVRIDNVGNSDQQTIDYFKKGVNFVPTAAFGGGTTGMTLASAVGRYMRIADRVLGYIAITFSAKGSSTGALAIKGIPFDCYVTTPVSVAVTGVNASLDSIPIYAQILPTGYTPTGGLVEHDIVLGKLTSGAFGTLDDTYFTDTSTIRISFMYEVTP